MTFALSANIRDIKNEGLKRRFIECIEAETAHFFQVAEAFYAQQPPTEADCLKLCDVVIELAERIFSKGDWDTSIFLQNTLKPLKQVYQEALSIKERLNVSSENSLIIPLIVENKTKLYVSLYQSNGHDLKQWALQLASLYNYMVGRPIYKKESDVIQAIRTKISQLSEAYVVVMVDDEQIISEDVRKDRFGNPIVSVLPNAIKRENILEFVHQGRRYHFLEKTQELVLFQPSEMN